MKQHQKIEVLYNFIKKYGWDLSLDVFGDDDKVIKKLFDDNPMNYLNLFKKLKPYKIKSTNKNYKKYDMKNNFLYVDERNNTIFAYDVPNSKVFVNHNYIWSPLELGFNLDKENILKCLKHWLSSVYEINVKSILSSNETYWAKYSLLHETNNFNKNVLTEDRYKGYKKFLKDNVFTDFPDYIINDMFRESGDLDYEQIKGMNKNQIIDYFLHKEGKRFFDRWGGFKGQKKSKIIKIKWEDLIEPLQKFLISKMSGKNSNFPNSRKKIISIMKQEPNLGDGNNEPIIIKVNNNGMVEDIPGGNHRLYAAFELNNFKPIKMNSYVSFI